jgi:ubiquinone biosynthesis UbiH/UbiF/VisC/COQ6 family hydroxylase
MSSDAIVVGAGVVGMACALGFAQSGLRVALVGPRVEPATPTPDAPFDTRIYAVAPATAALLTRLAVWPRLNVARTVPVERMRVFGDRGDELAFDAYGAAVERLATIVEEAELARVLDAACAFQPGIERHEAGFERLDASAAGVAVTLADGTALEGALLVGADGAQSAVRAAIGSNARVSDYQQSGVVCNFRAARPHLGTAWQWFTDEGVLALLPLADDHVSMVWSAPTALATELLALDADALAARVTARSGGVLGDLAPAGNAASFPLRLVVVDRLIGAHVALVGDAAHVVHPLAGQGLNLGLQDVAALLEVVQAREPIRAIGDAVLLRRYERSRAEPIALMRAATDGLARLFAADDPLARLARNAGLSAVNRLSPLKSLLIRQALG